MAVPERVRLGLAARAPWTSELFLWDPRGAYRTITANGQLTMGISEKFAPHTKGKLRQ